MSTHYQNEVIVLDNLLTPQEREQVSHIYRFHDIHDLTVNHMRELFHIMDFNASRLDLARAIKDEGTTVGVVYLELVRRSQRKGHF